MEFQDKSRINKKANINRKRHAELIEERIQRNRAIPVKKTLRKPCGIHRRKLRRKVLP